MTTATTALSTPAEVGERLNALLKAASEYAAWQGRMETLAEELGGRDGDVLEDALMPLPYYRDAVRGQIQAAAHDALHPEESADPLDVCQAIQDALDVLKFAMERQAEEKGDGDAR